MDKIKANFDLCMKCKNLRFISATVKDAQRSGTLVYCGLHGYDPPEMGRLDDKVFLDSGIKSELEFFTLCIIPNENAYIPNDCIFKLENLMRNDNPGAKTL